jgi:aminoglycoside phosphotransferase (APT) family kinase protein
MKPSDVRRAVDAAISTASSLGLAVENAVVLRDSTKLALRLVPCDVLARVAHASGLNPLELGLAQRLADAGSPVVAPEPRVELRVYSRGGFSVSFWSYHDSGTLWSSYESGTSAAGPTARYARALERLHAGMRKLADAPPHFMDWVPGAQEFLRRRDLTPMLSEADRELLGNTLASLTRSIRDRGAPEQILHGEPHPDNVLDTNNGLLFIDWDTPCRGPVEYDLAYVPAEVAALFPDANHGLVQECRGFLLARVALCRCEPDDQLPNRERELESNLRALRKGRPWPTLDALDRSTPPANAFSSADAGNGLTDG